LAVPEAQYKISWFFLGGLREKNRNSYIYLHIFASIVTTKSDKIIEGDKKLKKIGDKKKAMKWLRCLVGWLFGGARNFDMCDAVRGSRTE
jgi:hypothetical protein